MLIPKINSRGMRPIGLIPSSIRLLTRWLRKTVVEAFRIANPREYFFGVKGNDALVGAWRVAALAEHAKRKGIHSVAALYDVIKAFDHVDHERLQASMRRYGFNLVLLRFLLAVYSSPWAIVVGRVVTDAVCPTRSILPGDSFADLMMRMMLLPVLGTAAAKWDQLYVTCIADDVQFLARGKRDALCKNILGVNSDFTILMHDAKMLLPSKPGKLAVLCFDLGTEKQLARSFSMDGKVCDRACFGKSARCLCVDLSFRGRSTNVHQERVKNCKLKAIFFLRVRRGNASSSSMVGIARAGITQSGTLDAAVTGASDGATQELRRLYQFSFIDNATGRSTTMDCAITLRARRLWS